MNGKNSQQDRFIETVTIFLLLQSGFLFAGIIFTIIVILLYRMLLGGGFDLYGGAYASLGTVFKLVLLGVVVTIFSHIGFTFLPKSKASLWIFSFELIIDAIILYYFLSFALTLNERGLAYSFPIYSCPCFGILFLGIDLVFFSFRYSNLPIE